MDAVNGYVDQYKPWELAKQEGQEALLHRVVSTSLRAFARLSILLKPILPTAVARAETEVFGLTQPWSWSDLDRPALEKVQPFQHLFSRVDRDQVDRLIEANKTSL
jgi:methionyl-tRNA synthetase